MKSQKEFVAGIYGKRTSTLAMELLVGVRVAASNGAAGYAYDMNGTVQIALNYASYTAYV